MWASGRWEGGGNGRKEGGKQDTRGRRIEETEVSGRRKNGLGYRSEGGSRNKWEGERRLLLERRDGGRRKITEGRKTMQGTGKKIGEGCRGGEEEWRE